MASQPDTLLSGNSLVSFSSGMSEQERSDILYCLNYSEARAYRKYHRLNAWPKWINQYQAGLFNNGFKLSGVLSSDDLVITQPRDLLFVARDAIQTTGHSELSDLAYFALDKLLSSQQAQTFFQDWFSVSQSEGLQVVPCRKEATGGIEVMVCGMRMHTEVAAGSWLKRPTSSMTISMDGGAYLYTTQGYEPFREKVRKSLERETRLYFERLS